jgi:uncharacterized protein YprB with RNaseH-like and TPR domain
MSQQWTKEEQDEINKYWGSTITELALYKKLHALNPSRTFKAISRRLEDMKADGYKRSKDSAMNNLRVGYLDIEANNLNADFGYMLSWVMKEKDKPKIYYDVVNKKDLLDYKFDSVILKSLLKTMNDFDVIYAHYGSDRRFDIPFIRTRAYKNEMQHLLPAKNTLYIMDTYPIARNKLKLHSNRLDSIAQALNITKVKKTPLSSEHWMKGALGNPDALKYILKHNINDVLILEAVHKKLELIETKLYRSI